MNARTAKLIRRHVALKGNLAMFRQTYRSQKRRWNLIPRPQRYTARQAVLAELAEY